MGLFLYICLFLAFVFVIQTFTSPKQSKFFAQNKHTSHKNYNRIQHQLADYFLKKDKNKNTLAENLVSTRSKYSPFEFYKIKVIYALVSVGLFVILSLSSTKFLPFIFIGALAFFIPDFQLKRALKKSAYEKQLELPYYLLGFSHIYKLLNLKDAVEESLMIAGPYLEPHIIALNHDLQDGRNNLTALDNFAKSVDIEECTHFIMALKQAESQDKNTAIRILKEQGYILRELMKENESLVLEDKPAQMGRYNYILIFSFIVSILIFAVCVASELFSTI